MQQGVTQHHLSGVLDRNVLFKSTEETIKQIQKLEHFVEQLAWIHRMSQCYKDQRAMMEDERDMASKCNVSVARS